MTLSDLQKLDLAHVWHPCSQMKDYEDFPPVEIVRASGSYMYTADGEPLIDAISSWWCKSLGHAHPEIKAAVMSQMERFEHIIAANTCSEVLTRLSARLASCFPGLDRCFYADNGSTAIEVALKMALQYQQQSGHGERTEVMSLKNGYHGETLFTLSVSDCGLYSSPYEKWMHKILKIEGIPYVCGADDPRWTDMGDVEWDVIESQLAGQRGRLAAILFEPILQGSGGMLVYSPDFLRRLRRWCSANGVLMIADEIMTGFGRTGEMFACHHAGITPDLVCVSKGLTSGYAPMAVTLCSSDLYNAFYDDYFSRKAFMHSNTFCGYALGAAAALAVFDIFEREQIVKRVQEAAPRLRARMEYIGKETGMFKNIRHIGFMAAADLVQKDGTPFDPRLRTGYRCFQAGVKLGAWLRPLGDTLYFLPPLNTSERTLDDLANITLHTLRTLRVSDCVLPGA